MPVAYMDNFQRVITLVICPAHYLRNRPFFGALAIQALHIHNRREGSWATDHISRAI
ncbi:MAG: hypothetical protein U1F16_16110 [Turneriella sp.]